MLNSKVNELCQRLTKQYFRYILSLATHSQTLPRPILPQYQRWDFLAVDILHLKYSRCSSNLNIPTFLISYHHLFFPHSYNPSRLQQLVDLKSGHILMVSVWGGRQTVIYLMTLLRIAATAYLIAHGRIHAVTAPVNVLEYLTHPSLQ